MKPYIVKYRQVEEEEVEIGDFVIDTQWNKKHGVGKVVSFDGTVDMYDVKYPGLEVPVAANRDDCKKVELCLCSRDVKVGDKVRINENAEYTVSSIKDGYVYFGPHSIRGVIGKCFKVMGRISPLATWVKNGDEFDEDEISPVEDTRCTNIHDVEDWTEAEYETYVKYYALKGPCGHFH